VASTSTPITVWTLPPLAVGGIYVFPWDVAGAWVKRDRLIAIGRRNTTSSKGNARFRLLRLTRQDGVAAVADTYEPMAGEWIAIVEGATFAVASIKWWGFIDRIEREHRADADDHVGTVAALEVGHLLDRLRPRGWQRGTGLPSPAHIAEIEHPPTWNRTDGGGKIVGTTTTCPVTGKQVFEYRLDRADSSTATRQQLADHLLTWCLPLCLPTITRSGPSATLPVDVLDCRNATLCGALDICFPADLGLRWRIALSTDGSYWRLLVYEWATPSTRAVVADDVVSVETTESDGAVYDEVVVEGGRIVFMATMEFASGYSGAKAWTSTEQTAFLTGGDTGFGQTARDKTRAARAKSAAFQRFGLSAYLNTGGHLELSTEPGVSAPPGDYYFFPRVTFTDEYGAWTLDHDYQHDPLWTDARFLRNLPWERPADLAGGSTTKRQPEYLPPQAFTFDGTTWTDLLAPRERQPAWSLAVEDRGPWVWLKHATPELLAKAEWTSAAKWAGIDPTTHPRGLEWSDLLLTVALESDQRLSETRSRSGISADYIRRRFVLRRDDLQAWFVHRGTAVGVSNTGTVQRVGTGADLCPRNDYPKLYALADRLEDYLLVDRRSARIVGKAGAVLTSHLGSAISLGTLIKSIEEADGRLHELGGAFFEAEAVDYLSRTTTWELAAAELDAGALWGGGGSPSPLAGGPVSAISLQGTTAQAAERQAGIARAQDAKTQALPLPTMPPADLTPPVRDEVVAASAYTQGQVRRWTGSAWETASLLNTDLEADDLGFVEVLTAAAGTSAILATSGRVRWSSGGTAGELLYLSTTAGTLSTTPIGPAVARRVRGEDGTTAWLEIIPRGARREVAEVRIVTTGSDVELGTVLTHTTSGGARTWAAAANTSTLVGRRLGVVEASSADKRTHRVVFAGPMRRWSGGSTLSADGDAVHLYLDPDTAGALTTTQPTEAAINRPVIVSGFSPLLSTDCYFVLPAAPDAEALSLGKDYEHALAGVFEPGTDPIVLELDDSDTRYFTLDIAMGETETSGTGPNRHIARHCYLRLVCRLVPGASPTFDFVASGHYHQTAADRLNIVDFYEVGNYVWSIDTDDTVAAAIDSISSGVIYFKVDSTTVYSLSVARRGGAGSDKNDILIGGASNSCFGVVNVVAVGRGLVSLSLSGT
jgi:hypothetical protein